MEPARRPAPALPRPALAAPDEPVAVVPLQLGLQLHLLLDADGVALAYVVAGDGAGAVLGLVQVGQA